MTNSASPTVTDILNSDVKLTPMMAQYLEIKKDYLDTIVMFRMGDFYELFFEDAHKAARLLNITVTHRGKIGDMKIPMAGIPHHAAAAYIDRITQAGHKAAICEQVEDPSQAKGIVRRAVTQVVSPSMPFDVEKSDQFSHNFMACAAKVGNQFYLAMLDYTTGDFIGSICHDEAELIEKIALHHPKEFICHHDQWKGSLVADFVKDREVLVTELLKEHFNAKLNTLYIEKLIPQFKKDEVIKLHKEILEPVGALAFYVCSTQQHEKLYHIRPFRLEQEQGLLKVSLNTLRGIEILPRSKETYRESLLGHFDRTRSAMGAREMRQFFQAPLACLRNIEQRQTVIQLFLSNFEILETVREELMDVRDLERILVKTTNGKINATDMLNLSRTVKIYSGLEKSLKLFPNGSISQLKGKQLTTLKSLSKIIDKTISDEIGASLEKGNLIKAGCSKKRDELAGLNNNASDELLKLEAKYKKKSEITTMRIKHNNVFGYFIEISKGQANKAPMDFERKQTLVNCERYTTPELKKLENKILAAKEKLHQLEKQLFQEITQEITEMAQAILNLSRTIGRLDVFSTFAWVAHKEDLVKPNFHEDKKLIKVEGGWHPLIKTAVKDLFVPHDIELNEESYFALITGPNMAGKTTVMREMAIIQFLAQLGCFVPAKNADLGICDFLFSRLGASDDIVNGQSTFMVEMSETASILRHATNKSLIILDEVGRGTSTYDGLSIAWALVEHFVKHTKAICLFSTHYHELIELVDELNGAKNFTVETKNYKGDIKFLYRLIEQAASQSFGIYVAKLAGLPPSILQRSQQILQNLEEGELEKTQINQEEPGQLSFFSFHSPTQEQVEDNQYLKDLEKELKELKILEMTPMQAMQKLHEIQDQLSQ